MILQNSLSPFSSCRQPSKNSQKMLTEMSAIAMVIMFILAWMEGAWSILCWHGEVVDGVKVSEFETINCTGEMDSEISTAPGKYIADPTKCFQWIAEDSQTHIRYGCVQIDRLKGTYACNGPDPAVNPHYYCYCSEPLCEGPSSSFRYAPPTTTTSTSRKGRGGGQSLQRLPDGMGGGGRLVWAAAGMVLLWYRRRV